VPGILWYLLDAWIRYDIQIRSCLAASLLIGLSIGFEGTCVSNSDGLLLPSCLVAPLNSSLWASERNTAHFITDRLCNNLRCVRYSLIFEPSDWSHNVCLSCSNDCKFQHRLLLSPNQKFRMLTAVFLLM
jgi:hypothetical protein